MLKKSQTKPAKNKKRKNLNPKLGKIIVLSKSISPRSGNMILSIFELTALYKLVKREGKDI